MINKEGSVEVIDTYEKFMEKYGKRPPDIVFAIARKDALSEVVEGLDKIIKNSPDLKSFEHEVVDYVEGFRMEVPSAKNTHRMG